MMGWAVHVWMGSAFWESARRGKSCASTKLSASRLALVAVPIAGQATECEYATDKLQFLGSRAVQYNAHCNVLSSDHCNHARHNVRMLGIIHTPLCPSTCPHTVPINCFNAKWFWQLVWHETLPSHGCSIISRQGYKRSGMPCCIDFALCPHT